MDLKNPYLILSKSMTLNIASQWSHLALSTILSFTGFFSGTPKFGRRVSNAVAGSGISNRGDIGGSFIVGDKEGQSRGGDREGSSKSDDKDDDGKDDTTFCVVKERPSPSNAAETSSRCLSSTLHL